MRENHDVADRQYQFEWNEAKAAANVRKHGVSFELACTIFSDPHLLTVADLGHSAAEERWFSIGCASSGAVIAVAYLWTETRSGVTKVRIISARLATRTEIRHYQERS